MKLVKIEEDRDIIRIEDLKDNDIIGFETHGAYKGNFVYGGENSNIKGLIIGIFRPDKSTQTIPNFTATLGKESMPKAVLDLLANQEIKKVIVFDDYKELYKWLSED